MVVLKGHKFVGGGNLLIANLSYQFSRMFDLIRAVVWAHRRLEMKKEEEREIPYWPDDMDFECMSAWLSAFMH